MNLIIDIGLGMLAVNTLKILSEHQGALVVAVEPNPICIDYNMPHLKPYIESGRCLLYPFALADRPTGDKGNLYITANDPGCSSLYVPTQKFQSDYQRPLLGYVEIEYRTLDDVFELSPVKNAQLVDFVKIDAQGSDLAIIRGGAKLTNR